MFSQLIMIHHCFSFLFTLLVPQGDGGVNLALLISFLLIQEERDKYKNVGNG